MASPDPITILILGPMVPADAIAARIQEAQSRYDNRDFASAVAALHDAAKLIEGAVPERPPEPGQDQTMRPHAGTLALQALVREMVAGINAAPDYSGPVVEDVIVPEENRSNDIIPGILKQIERSVLVLIDLTGSRPNVTYEVGLIYALGMPHILLTADGDVPFYFKNSFHIARFDLSPPFDPAKSGHAALRDRIRAFLTSPVAAQELMANQVSTFFRELPIIDISGPAGLAAGYWKNSIGRFARMDGHFYASRALRGEDCELRTIRWEAQKGLGEAGSGEFEIGGYIAVRPPGNLISNYENDTKALKEAVSQLGFTLFNAVIWPPEKHLREGKDIGPFRAQLLARPRAEGGAAFVNPAVIMEIPSTLYALQEVPRIRCLIHQPGGGAEFLAKLKRLRFKDMVDRFGRVMDVFLEDAGLDPTIRNRFRFIELGDLPRTLTELGVAVP